MPSSHPEFPKTRNRAPAKRKPADQCWCGGCLPCQQFHAGLRALRQRLAEAGSRFRQAKIASALGMDPSTIAKYESGERHIPYSYLEAFAKYAGWPVTDLIAKAKKELDGEVSLLAREGS